MNFSSLSALWASLAVPVLPTAPWLPWALHLAWALVLACGVAYGLRTRSGALRWGSALVLALWTALPGPASPAHWLGLAFQAPSLMTVGLCSVCLCKQWRSVGTLSAPSLHSLWVGAGVVLGWVLLLDTLAWFPVSVYAWGFGAGATGAAMCVLLPLWIKDRRGAALALWVLMLFVLTRWPSGNLWDALLDPWLWVVLQALLLLRGWRWLRAWRAGAAIHA